MLGSLAKVSLAADLDQGLAMLKGNDHACCAPDVIVLLQSYPGQFAADCVEEARRIAPLARWIAVLGTWCEGEARSGQPLPGVMRVYWHQAESHFRQELALLDAGLRSSWMLPVTATDEERLLAMLDEPTPIGTGNIAIHATNRMAFDYLADMCHLGGYTTTRIDPHNLSDVRDTIAAIYDSPALNGSIDDRFELESVRSLVGAMAPAPVYVLANFPRTETARQWKALGVRAVLAKPIGMLELLRCLRTAFNENP